MNNDNKIKIKKVPSIGRYLLDWDEESAVKIGERILKLKDDQIIALCSLVGVIFKPDDRREVLEEMRAGGWQSGHLPIVVYEANSKENLMWWLEFFEKHNR